MDPLSDLAIRLAGEPHYQTLPEDLYGIGAPWEPALAEWDRAVSDAFRARADARMSRGEYHLALADYGRALNTTPLPFGPQKNPAASAGRCEARDSLVRFFVCGGDPESLPAEASDAVRAAVRAARLPTGHLVVAECGGVLAAYPLTDEGRQAAVAHADALATDGDTRSRIDNLYLADTDSFDAVVFAHERGRAVEIYRARPREETDPIDPQSDVG